MHGGSGGTERRVLPALRLAAKQQALAGAAEIAGMVVYRVRPEAAYITGAQHTIDGGFGA